MDETSARLPLLPTSGEEGAELHSKATNLFKPCVKYGLKLVMWVIFLTWVAVIYLNPSSFMGKIFDEWTDLTEGTIFGVAGTFFLAFSAPVLVIALLGCVYVALFPGDYNEKGKSRFSSFRLWTFPVIVDGPLGVVSAAELIGIVVFASFIIWALCAYIISDASIISETVSSPKEKACLMLEMLGFAFASVGMFCIIFLFLPISRGSSLLRLIDIPFEHAIRYHIWLGHVTMLLFTLHGLCFIVSFALQGALQNEIINWQDTDISVFPGVISLSAGLLMWATSLSPVRKNYFELFFYTHQLYIVFVIFFALHVGYFIFCAAAGAIFLFVLDRFLRFCQSRTAVDVLSAKCLACEAIELTLSKPQNMTYSPLSFIFLQVRELSWSQWHPFSVSSSPLDGRLHLTVLIKGLGQWTQELRESILNVQKHPQMCIPYLHSSKITAAVEGPYGHESPYYLQYENLILVAGGIGISPFIAILRDILHRATEKRTCLPKNILLVWSVKKSKELSLLSTVDVTCICSSFPITLNLEVQTYVTQESEPPMEEDNLSGSEMILYSPETSGSSMSVLVGSGNVIWFGIYMFSSIVGFIIFVSLIEIFYLRRLDISTWWLKGLLYIVCMILGTITFGGAVIMLWSWWEMHILEQEKVNNSSQLNEQAVSVSRASHTNLVASGPTCYGQRPNFRSIFSSVSDRWGGVDVGVLVCGPGGLQSSVAAECRFWSFRGLWNHPVFHFHSHSFNL
ncbi:ferric reduction oxidase 7, chloroplastic-like [Nymphaea colorata]|nr:ferric reduction oxidase 7, chloroplastic-like [Nymphaea colorata]